MLNIDFNQQGHRGSSPQIRAFGPDGRSVLEGPLIASGNRSPSPLRAASFDTRAPSGIAPSHGSLASLASLVSETPSSPRAPRCLSPLLIPPRYYINIILIKSQFHFLSLNDLIFQD